MVARRKHSYKKSISCVQSLAVTGIPLKGKQNSRYSFSCTALSVKLLNYHYQFGLTSCRTSSTTTSWQVPNSKLLKIHVWKQFNDFQGKKKIFCNKGIWVWKNRLREESLEKWSTSLRKRVSSSVWRLGKDSSVFLLLFSETSPALGEQVEYFWR